MEPSFASQKQLWQLQAPQSWHQDSLEQPREKEEEHCENSNFILDQINAETSTWPSSGYFDASKNFRSNVAEIPHQDPDQKEKYSCKLVNTKKPK